MGLLGHECEGASWPKEWCAAFDDSQVPRSCEFERTVGEDEVCNGFGIMARSDRSRAQASSCVYKGGGNCKARVPLQGMGNLVCQCQSSSTPKEFAGKDEAADAKRVLPQGLGLVGYACAGGASTAGAAAEDGAAEILSVPSDTVP